MKETGDQDIKTGDVTTKLPLGYIQVTKKDSLTGENMSGLQFGIYSDSACRNLVQTITTGSNGIAKSTGLDLGVYYIKELAAAPNYVLNTTIQRVNVTEAVVNNNITNKPNTATVEVSKLDNQTGKKVTKSDTTFALYEWSKSSNTWVKPTHIISNTYNTATDGTITLKQKTGGTNGTYTAQMYYNASNDGRFRVVEYSRPFGYTTTNWSKEFKITQDGQVFTYDNEVKNNQVKAQIIFKKNDSEVNHNTYGESYAQGDSTLEGAVYGLYAKENILSPDDGAILYAAGTKITEKTTDISGKITWDDLYLGKYYIKEITASKGYLLDATEYEIDLEEYYRSNYYNKNDQSTSKVIYQNTQADNNYENSEKRVISKEKVQKQSFQLTKLGLNEDSTMGNPLQGAGFKVYLIKDLSKVKDGTIKPDVDGNYKAQDFLGYDFSEEQTALNFTENADGIRVGEMFTNEDGILTSPELAYGKYIVIESTVPDNHFIVDPFIVNIEQDSRTPKKMVYPIDRDFTARIRIIKKDDTTDKVVLKANAAYRIWSVTEQKYIEQTTSYPNNETHGTEKNPYRTTDKGYLTTPYALQVGDYELEEVQAPEGYVLAGKEAEEKRERIAFSINSTSVYEMDPELGRDGAIIIVEQKNSPQVGNVTVLKQGEFLSNSQKQEEGYQLEYTTRPVTDAKFAIYAKEDILTQDNQVDENGQRTKIYEKDQFVREVDTNSEGKAIFEKLPLGSYYIKETKAGNGFILNKEVKEVEFTYQGQDIAIVYKDFEYINERQKVEIHVTKKDRETDQTLQGAIFGLYTKEAINYTDNEGNPHSIPADELIAKATTTENGMAVFQDENLPHAKYYIKELQAPKGYVTNIETIDMDATYSDQNLTIKMVETDFTNQITKLKIKIKDKETDVGLKDTKVVIKDEDGNVVGEYEVDENGEIEVKGLEVGKQYYIEEEKERTGYVKDLLFDNNSEDPDELPKGKDLNGNVTFELKDTENEQKLTLENMAKVGQMQIQKIGEVLVSTTKDENGNTVFNYEKQRIGTAKFEVYVHENIVHPDGKQGIILEAGTKILEGETEEGLLTITKLPEELIADKPEIIQLLLKRGLPLGTYEIREVQAPQGYWQQDVVKIFRLEAHKIQDIVEKQTVVIENEKQSTNIGKTNPKVLIEKQAEKEVYKAGEEVVYTIKVTNTGNVHLKDIEVKENMLSGKFDETEGSTLQDNNTIIIEQLKPGEEKVLTYRYIVSEETKGKVDNDVTVIATPVNKVTQEDGTEKEEILDKVTDQDSETVVVDQVLEKTVKKKAYSLGNSVEYTLDITNPYDTAIENAKILDDKITVGSIIKTSKEGITVTEDGIIELGTIEPRERIIIVYQYKIPEDSQLGELTNTATLTGNVGEQPVEETDNTTVEVKKSAIEITKQAEKTTYKRGEVIDYIIKVTNTGKTILNNIVVQENLIPGKFQEKAGIEVVDDQTVKIDKLEVGQSIELTYQYTIEQSTMLGSKIKNNVTVTGDGIIDNPEDPENPTVEKVEDETTEEIVVSEGTENRELGIYKKDIETGENIPGVIFGLYASEDILGKDGKVLIKKDALIEQSTTSENGYAKFKADLPIGKYYVLELKPQKQYIKNDSRIDIDSTEILPSEKEYLVKLEMQNKKTEINVEKVEKIEDLMQRALITGAKLQILDDEQQVIKEWESTETAFNIKGLETEEPYILHEAEPAKGYTTAKDIPFSITTKGDLVIDGQYTLKDLETPTIIMQDDVTKLELKYVDEVTEDLIPGGKLQIQDKDGNIVGEIDDTGVKWYEEKIPVGEYTIVEVETPEGYEPAGPMTFTVKDTDEVQELVIKKKRLPLDLQIEKYASCISINGIPQTGATKPGEMPKVEINKRKINSQNVEVEYTIKVTNTGKVKGQVGKIIEQIPQGLTFNANKNPKYWKVESNNQIVTTEFKDQEIQPGQSIQIKIILDWSKNSNNFGDKENIVKIEGISNKLGFTEETTNNNTYSAHILLSVKTGREVKLAREILIVVLVAIIVLGTMAVIEIKIFQKKDEKQVK